MKTPIAQAWIGYWLVACLVNTEAATQAVTWQELILGESSAPLPSIQSVTLAGENLFERERLETIAREQVIDRPPSLENIESARWHVSEYLYEQGYLNSGAIISPEEDLSDGNLTITIISGKASEYRVTTEPEEPCDCCEPWLSAQTVRPRFYQRRLEHQVGTPLSRSDLSDILNTWPLYYPVEELNLAVLPGYELGEAILDMKIKEKQRFRAGVAVDNHRAASSGAEQVSLLVGSDSLTQRHDTLDLTYGLVRNLDGKADWLGTDQIGVNYSIPVHLSDTRLATYYHRSASLLVEEPFDTLDLNSRFQLAGISLSQPIRQTPKQDWTVSLAGEYKRLETTIAGQRVSLTEGMDDGLANVATLRLSTSFLQRTTNYVFGSRASVTVGVDALGATHVAPERDASFATVAGELQYVRQLGDKKQQLVLKSAGQITSSPLLTTEQMPIGGVNSVRGFRENSLVRDMGVHGSVEYRLPIHQKQDRSVLQLAFFSDIGYGQNRGTLDDRIRFISSVGAGILASPTKSSDLRLYVGLPLRDISDQDDDLQDYGIHFSLRFWAF